MKAASNIFWSTMSAEGGEGEEEEVGSIGWSAISGGGWGGSGVGGLGSNETTGSEEVNDVSVSTFGGKLRGEASSNDLGSSLAGCCGVNAASRISLLGVSAGWVCSGVESVGRACGENARSSSSLSAGDGCGSLLGAGGSTDPGCI